MKHRTQHALPSLAACVMAIALSAAAAIAAPARAADEVVDHSQHHHDMATMQETRRSEGAYILPASILVRQDGTKVPLAQALDLSRPTVLNFIYTSCTAICPVTSQIFADFRAKLGVESSEVNMVSISIDPEYDTPARLAEYARRFDADRNWSFYTGKLADSILIQRAFETYRGDKMNHAPVTFIRAAMGKKWTRVDGFASADTLLAEYRRLAKM